MKVFRELIPEHIPNGYNINKNMLIPVNNELKNFRKRVLFLTLFPWQQQWDYP